MKNYRPLLIRQIDLRLPGFRIRRLRLNRHLREVDTVAEHAHSFTQILCYLSGGGEILVAGSARAAGPGSVVFLPPRARHAFREQGAHPPLCLVLDLDWRGAARRNPAFGRLTLADASDVRRAATELTRLSDPNETGSRLVVASAVLRILDGLLRALGLVPARPGGTHPLVARVARALREPGVSRAPVAALARRAGCSPDHLNRVFKSTTGQTVREFRDTVATDRARRLLRDRSLVKDAALELGFVDQNYFARWFKKQTGLSPSQAQT